MTNETPKKKDNIDKIIQEDGHSFQCKVVNEFRNRGWNVIISPYYNDNIKEISREIDIICNKESFVKNMLGKEIAKLNIRLFIECKYIKNDVIFWFDRTDDDVSLDFLKKQFSFLSDKDLNNFTNHYSNMHLAKLFHEKEKFFDAIKQILHAMIYFRYKKIAQSECSYIPEYTINYPVIICNSFEKFYYTDFCQSKAQSIENNFLADIRYAYIDPFKKEPIDESFLIDVIEFKNIDNFLDIMIKKDEDTIKQILHFKSITEISNSSE